MIGLGSDKKHWLTLANFFRMNPIMNIGQKWSAWPCLQFGMPKLSVGLAIGLRLRFVILRQFQTIKLVPHKNCDSDGEQLNQKFSMVFTVCVPQLPHADYVTVSSQCFMLLEWMDVKFDILR